MQGWLAQLDRERLVQEIRLGLLARGEVAEMLAGIFEKRHTAFDMRRYLSGELLDTVYTLTEGNPFFVEETLTSLLASGNIAYVQGFWNRISQREVYVPRSIQDAVQRRTASLSDAARYVLTLASVAGRHFDFTLLLQLTHYSEEQLLLIMKELVSARLVSEDSAEQFSFRHALTRQAIYTQLLVRERSGLHRTIAETMEQLSPGAHERRLEELAYHFYQGQAWQQALEYARRAGEKVLRLYSHRAAIDYFSWALDASEHLSLAPAAALYRARGQAYETLGEFERAQQNYIQALHAACTLDDRVAEWQSAIDLGFLWAGRDYAQAETWFRQALSQAQALKDPSLHARSLNRIANWHLNVEQVHEALRYHRDALSIFEQLHDERGIAETLDLLGMVSYLAGDMIQGTFYYQQAIVLFHELGDLRGLTSSLATMTLRGPTYQTDALVTEAHLSEAQQDAQQALAIAREIGHRPSEAYALFQLGLCLGSQGEYGSALAAVRQSLDIAEEIEHRQWQTAAHCVLGGLYCGLLSLQQAQEHCERALALAREIGSLFWTRIATGYLASIAIALHQLERAQTLLLAEPASTSSAQTMAQRLVACASVELALARGEPERALASELFASDARPGDGRSGLRVLILRAAALAALQRPGEAAADLLAARGMASQSGARPLHWRICVDLGRLYCGQEKNSEAEEAFASARTLIDDLAATITDEALRATFLQQTTAMLPQPRPLPAKHVAKQAFGGLTAREREVAVLLAQGKFNREIADDLVVSERTVETHVSNMMFKLGFTSRRQIAAWAVERGLTTQS